MNLNFKVKTTRDFIYNPTELKITIIPNLPPVYPNTEIDTENITIRTECIATISDGTVTEVRTMKVPASYLNVFGAFDPATMQPSIDTSALSTILAAFNLELDQ